LGAPLDDKLCPAKAKVEAGKYRAEASTEVISMDH